MMNDKESSYSLLNGDERDDSQAETVQYKSPLAWLTKLHLFIFLLMSCGLNGFLVVSAIRPSRPSPPDTQTPTEYAGLINDVMIPWEDETPYSTGNYTAQDLLWGELRADSGVIALPKSYAAAHSLRRGSPFPWDPEKEIYLINGYHSLHCVSRLYLALKEHREGLPQSASFDHSVHCLDWLRQNIMCQADDTPLYTTNSRHADSGFGQYRQCRDWSKLRDWAEEHTACYRNGNFVVEDKLESQIGRFKFCKADSPYLQKIRMYYGKGEDWFPADEEVYTPH